VTEIRRLDDEDLLQLLKLHTIVYNIRKDYSKEDNQKKEPLAHPTNWAWGAFKGKKLLAGMFEIEFLMRFDGHSKKMSGISGVGTLPEARKGGHIRRISEKMLIEAYEKGVVFSTLAPFSHDFYRKFGYEIASDRFNISIPTKSFSTIKPTGEYINILPGDDFSLLKEVHSAYIADINHGVDRGYWQNDRAWKIFTKDEPCATGSFIYLWKDENGIARSYIKYRDQYEDGENQMYVSELAFIDIKGLYGILGIVSGLSTQYENFKWQMPSFIDLWDIIGEAWYVKQKKRPREMTRVINVKTALELMRRPDGEGKYVIEVKDDNIPANNGKYLVEFSGKETKVSITTKDADISCDILTFNQLVLGYRTLQNMLYTRKNGLEINNNIKTLNSVFTLRPQHLTEYF
jgi:predicted acetyltransferase